MKRTLLLCLPLLAACGASPVGTTTPSAASVPAAPPRPVEKTAEKAGAALPATKESLDPLSVGGDLEAAAVPTIVQTPAKGSARSRAAISRPR